ncbi:MAG: hypothetical protein ILO34_08010, partial [Kiritimatiellae bacterium]|nr:hypothetical protein [Kiritimatiellia bacterium]
FWGAGGGVINLAYDHNSSSGSYLIDIYGTHPYIECGNHLLHCATSGHNSNGLTMDLVFHVPAGGYARAPLNVWQSTFYATIDQPLRVSIAKDSPARRAGRAMSTEVIHSDYGFSYYQEGDKHLLDYNDEDTPVFSYNNTGTGVFVSFPNSGTVIVVR